VRFRQFIIETRVEPGLCRADFIQAMQTVMFKMITEDQGEVAVEFDGKLKTFRYGFRDVGPEEKK
jgi:5'-3' exonuclease